MRLHSAVLLAVFWGLGPCPLLFARDSGSSYGPGVLVSPPVQASGSNQYNPTDDGRGGASDSSYQGDGGRPRRHQPRQAQNSGDLSQNDQGNDSNPPDGIVAKATEVTVGGMAANLKLTQDQINSVRPIVAENIGKTRALQQSLQKGDIDAKTMVARRQQLLIEENRQLAAVLSPQQMQAWMNIENDESQ
ncbi:MAG: hypothetical protein KGJ95_00985 [Candidatus Omnitrophica bacterium]|nr:hypothetical protein [Candidatus Omnitrophota bacterium]